MAVQRDWEFRHLDVKTAYLHGDLEEEVYMASPQGLEDVPEGYVLKLKKALYGLKQAGRQWYEHLRATMKDFGLKCAESNPHTFVFNGKIGGVTHTLIVPIYVDDIFLFRSKTLANQFEEFIPQYYDITDPCNAQYLLGIRVTRQRTNDKYIMLDQVRFTEQTISNITQYYGEVKERNTVLLAEDLVVIVMTFWYVFWNGLNFFKNFLFSLGIDHDPPCSPCSHDLCLFLFSYVFTRVYGQEKSSSYYDLFMTSEYY